MRRQFAHRKLHLKIAHRQLHCQFANFARRQFAQRHQFAQRQSVYLQFAHRQFAHRQFAHRQLTHHPSQLAHRQSAHLCDSHRSMTHHLFTGCVFCYSLLNHLKTSSTRSSGLPHKLPHNEFICFYSLLILSLIYPPLYLSLCTHMYLSTADCAAGTPPDGDETSVDVFRETRHEGLFYACLKLETDLLLA